MFQFENFSSVSCYWACCGKILSESSNQFLGQFRRHKYPGGDDPAEFWRAIASNNVADVGPYCRERDLHHCSHVHDVKGPIDE